MNTSWRTVALPLALLLAAVLLAYRETALAMVAIWSRSETFTHAFVVPPIVLWLIWRKRAELAQLTPQPVAWILLPLAVTAVVWLMGELAAVNAATQLALTTMLVLAVPALLGWRITRLLLFPLGFLFFSVPIGEFLMPQLMSWTADFTVLALRLTGIPVYREAQNFVIPSGHWSVVEACSGIRYLMASVMVGSLFAYLNYRSLRRRITFVAVATAVPIVANWVRAYLIVLLGHLSNNQLAVGADHLIYGWVFFGVVIFLMFMIGARWAEPDEPVSQAVAPAGTASVSRHGLSWAVAAAGAVLVTLPQFAMQRIGDAPPGTPPTLDLPQRWSSGWERVDSAKPALQPNFVNPATHTNEMYVSQGREVGVYVAYYRGQREGHKLVSSENVLVRSNDINWAVVGHGSLKVDAAGQSVVVHTARLRPPPSGSRSAVSADLVAWQLYWVGGHLTANDAWAKAQGALSRLRGDGDDGAAIVVYTRSSSDVPGGAEAALAAFLSSNLGEIQTRLRQVRDAAP